MPGIACLLYLGILVALLWFIALGAHLALKGTPDAARARTVMIVMHCVAAGFLLVVAALVVAARAMGVAQP